MTEAEKSPNGRTPVTVREFSIFSRVQAMMDRDRERFGIRGDFRNAKLIDRTMQELERRRPQK